MLHTAFSKMEPQLAWSPPEPETIVGTTHHAGPGNFLAAVQANFSHGPLELAAGCEAAFQFSNDGGYVK